MIWDAIALIMTSLQYHSSLTLIRNLNVFPATNIQSGMIMSKYAHRASPHLVTNSILYRSRENTFPMRLGLESSDNCKTLCQGACHLTERSDDFCTGLCLSDSIDFSDHSGMGSANGRRGYIATLCLIGWSHNQNVQLNFVSFPFFENGEILWYWFKINC